MILMMSSRNFDFYLLSISEVTCVCVSNCSLYVVIEVLIRLLTLDVKITSNSASMCSISWCRDHTWQHYLKIHLNFRANTKLIALAKHHKLEFFDTNWVNDFKLLAPCDSYRYVTGCNLQPTGMSRSEIGFFSSTPLGRYLGQRSN